MGTVFCNLSSFSAVSFSVKVCLQRELLFVFRVYRTQITSDFIVLWSSCTVLPLGSCRIPFQFWFVTGFSVSVLGFVSAWGLQKLT